MNKASSSRSAPDAMFDTARSDEAFASALSAWMDRAANTANNNAAACRDAAGGSKRYARLQWSHRLEMDDWLHSNIGLNPRRRSPKAARASGQPSRLRRSATAPLLE